MKRFLSLLLSLALLASLAVLPVSAAEILDPETDLAYIDIRSDYSKVIHDNTIVIETDFDGTVSSYLDPVVNVYSGASTFEIVNANPDPNHHLELIFTGYPVQPNGAFRADGMNDISYTVSYEDLCPYPIDETDTPLMIQAMEVVPVDIPFGVWADDPADVVVGLELYSVYTDPATGNVDAYVYEYFFLSSTLGLSDGLGILPYDVNLSALGSESTPEPPSDNPTAPPTGSTAFTDVPADHPYLDAIYWAVENGITYGAGNNMFQPERTCMRGEVVTFLWRLAGCPKMYGVQNPFKDLKPGDYCYDAALWAVDTGITSGTGDGTTFSPNKTCTTAETQVFVWNFFGKPVLDHGTHPVYDLVSDCGWYADAAAFMIGAEVYPEEKLPTILGNCPRAEIMYYMYAFLG